MMTFFKKLLYHLLDSWFSWFTPGWRRQGYEMAQAIRRYVNMRRHCMSTDELEVCESRYAELKAALLAWDKEETVRITKRSDLQCSSMPGFSRGAVVEMVESFFIIMVVFLGIRTYYAQPFRIPTGSMQPSLNGIIVKHVDEIPPLPQRLWEKITRGASYVEAVADIPKRIISISEHSKWILFTETVLTFDDGSTVTVPSARGAVVQYLREQGKIVESIMGIHMGTYQPGELIIRARADAGDMVVVNRVAYHFRKPKRGETFVFDTRGINTSMTSAGAARLADQSAATHYIKRLCGLPGDTLFVQSPELLVNGEPAREATIARVAAGQPPFNREGYQQLSSTLQAGAWLTDLSPMSLRNPSSTPILREYAALGDNTTNSLDSRYWGPVRQFNLVGPAGFTLWPFTEHWGLIE
ncbi:MAG: signal peptidase I [Akkermansiaceae bacterium]|nr:signal peptidase I [Akkermansiaceae bacterium]